MAKMIFDAKQPQITIVELPDGMRDITICVNEEEFTEINTETESTYTGYRYDGNRFRTIYKLEETDILADLDRYLEYTSDSEPTQEQLKHDENLLDNFVLQLMEEGVI
jgi:hypothetical protein